MVNIQDCLFGAPSSRGGHIGPHRWFFDRCTQTALGLVHADMLMWPLAVVIVLSWIKYRGCFFYRSEILWLFLKFYTGLGRGKKKFVGFSNFPLWDVCRRPLTKNLPLWSDCVLHVVFSDKIYLLVFWFLFSIVYELVKTAKRTQNCFAISFLSQFC